MIKRKRMSYDYSYSQLYIVHSLYEHLWESKKKVLVIFWCALLMNVIKASVIWSIMYSAIYAIMVFFMEQLTNYSMVNILYLLFKITEVIIPKWLVDISFCKKQTWDKCYIILLAYVTSFLHRSYVAWEIDSNWHYVLIILVIERFFLRNSQPWNFILSR